MRAILDVLVPLLAVAFVVFRMRRSVLAVCAVPLVLAMGEGEFLLTYGRTFRVPILPRVLVWTDVVFPSLVVAWMVVREVRPRRAALRGGWDIGIVVVLLGLLGLEVVLAWAADGSVKLGVLYQVVILGESLWVSVVATIGWAGLAVYAAVFGMFLLSTIRLVFILEDRSRLALVVLIVITWEIIRSFASAGFVSVFPPCPESSWSC